MAQEYPLPGPNEWDPYRDIRENPRERGAKPIPGRRFPLIHEGVSPRIVTDFADKPKNLGNILKKIFGR